jgi:hypothetical protein
MHDSKVPIHFLAHGKAAFHRTAFRSVVILGGDPAFAEITSGFIFTFSFPLVRLPEIVPDYDVTGAIVAELVNSSHVPR